MIEISATDAAPAVPGFAPTRWTLVLRAQGQGDAAGTALAELCQCYWQPIYRFLLRQGRPEDEARELAQEFFARVLERKSLPGFEKGRARFRSYLLGALKHFLANQRQHQRRLKRGGGATHESLDATGDGGEALQVPDPGALPPDAVFDRHWALAVMEGALRNLQREFVRAGKNAEFDALKPWLAGRTIPASHTEAARQLGTSEAAIKVAVHRLRKRFRELIRAELAQTVADPAEIEPELRYLIEVLSRC